MDEFKDLEDVSNNMVKFLEKEK